jgi:3-hydroxyacyl-CoA dehydrogenase
LSGRPASRPPPRRSAGHFERPIRAGWGRKSGAGFHTYTDSKPSRTTDATVHGLIELASGAHGITRRAISPVAIQRRALLAMVNEAALLLTEGVGSRPADVDVVLVQGYGFPRWEGGPVFWAGRQDPEQLAAELQQMAREAGPGFVPGELDALLAR